MLDSAGVRRLGLSTMDAVMMFYSSSANNLSRTLWPALDTAGNPHFNVNSLSSFFLFIALYFLFTLSEFSTTEEIQEIMRDLPY